MPAAPDTDDPQLRAAYSEAFKSLPVLPRVILRLHQSNALPYAEISHRLSIPRDTVQDCIAEALAMISAIMEGDAPKRFERASITHAEAILRQQHRAYCEAALCSLGITSPPRWNESGDDDVTVCAAVMKTMPRKLLRPLLLFSVDRLTFRQITIRTFSTKAKVRQKLLDAIKFMDREPMTFEEWLREFGAQHCERRAAKAGLDLHATPRKMCPDGRVKN